jgi:hypothetical protein
MTTLGATLVDLNPAHSPGRAGLVNGVAPISGLALGLSAAAPSFSSRPLRHAWCSPCCLAGRS